MDVKRVMTTALVLEGDAIGPSEPTSFSVRLGRTASQPVSTYR